MTATVSVYKHFCKQPQIIIEFSLWLGGLFQISGGTRAHASTGRHTEKQDSLPTPPIPPTPPTCARSQARRRSAPIAWLETAELNFFPSPPLVQRRFVVRRYGCVSVWMCVCHMCVCVCVCVCVCAKLPRSAHGKWSGAKAMVAFCAEFMFRNAYEGTKVAFYRIASVACVWTTRVYVCTCPCTPSIQNNK
jgi:hypothetical protein